MGNCICKGFRVIEVDEMVKIVTTNGGIMELYAPITAETITNEFPGHAIYRSSSNNNGLISSPLLHNEELQGGYFYYLLPLNCDPKNITCVPSPAAAAKAGGGPYRMSFDNQRLVKRSAAAEVFPRYNSSGVWKVKLVINPEQLAEILGKEARTDELMESVRTVAKCGNGNRNGNGNGNAFSSSLGTSDEWSVCSSSRKGSV